MNNTRARRSGHCPSRATGRIIPPVIHRPALLAAVLAMACSAPPEVQHAPSPANAPSPAASASASQKPAWSGSSPWALPVAMRTSDTPVGQIQYDARVLDALVTTPFAKKFLAA